MSQTIESPAPTPVTEPAAALLSARGIDKSFLMGDTRVSVLKGCDLEVEDGEFIAIEGRSGSGKSTLLHVLAALDSVDGGSLQFNGRGYTRTMPNPPPRWLAAVAGVRPGRAMPHPVRLLLYTILCGVGLYLVYVGYTKVIHGRVVAGCILIGLVAGLLLLRWLLSVARFIGRLKGESPAARLRNKQFGFVFQFYYLLPELNVLENTMLAPQIELSILSALSNRTRLRERAKSLLEQLGLGHRLRHLPGQLSGGERQRVAIARALMNEPKILFADEPTGNLDYETGRQIMDVLEALHRDHGQTIVMVTHDRTLAREADRVLVLKDGRLSPTE